MSWNNCFEGADEVMGQMMTRYHIHLEWKQQFEVMIREPSASPTQWWYLEANQTICESCYR